MPGELKDIRQKVGMDASEYHSESLLIVRDNVAMQSSFDDVTAKIGKFDTALRALPDSKSIKVTADTSAAMAQIAAVDAALGKLQDREITVRVRYVTEGAPPDAGSSAVIGRSVAASAGDSGSSAMLLRQMQDSAASFGRMEATMGRVEEHLAAIRADTARAGKGGNGEGLALFAAAAASLAGAAAADASSRGGDQGTANALKGAVNLLAQGVAGKGGGTGAAGAVADAAMAVNAGSNAKSASRTSASADAAIRAWQAETQKITDAANRAFRGGQGGYLTGMSRARTTAGYVSATEAAGAGGNEALIAAAAQAFGITGSTPAPGGSGGPGAGVATQLAAVSALSRIAGGGSSGGGGGGGGLAAFFGGGMAGKIFGGALPTLMGAHMATMLTMEIASQVIPAVVAAGAAAAVGYQGGAAAYQRGRGIYAAGEALGGAYGVTPGQLFGMSSGYQIAQNQATGGVYGIIGSIMRMAGGATGQGSILGPGGMGVQTVAMIDRGLANMVGSGRMGQISSALGGGTGALQTIGNIAGNLGDSLLNLAPVLPGMGGMLFGALKGGTGVLRSVTSLAGGGGLWPLLFGTGLAAEAGWRWGGPILAGGKLPGFLGGAKFTGLAGLAERFGLGATGAAAGTDASGLAGFLAAGAGGLPIAGIAALAAASAYGISQGTFGTPAAQQMGGYMRSINASFGAGSLTPITQALFHAAQAQQNLPGVGFATVGGGAAAGGGGGVLGFLSGSQGYAPGQTPVGQGIAELRREGLSPQQALATIQGQYAANAQNAANQLGQMAAAGPAAQKALSDLGVKGASLGQAFDYLTMAMISPKDVGPGGKLDKTAMSQLASFVKTYSIMGSGGQTSASAILSASGADYVMASPQMKSLSQINQALDSMTAIMTGGAANASALYQATAAAPAAVAQAMAAPALTATQRAAAQRLVAKGLAQGPFTQVGAAAWQAFTNPQTGIMAASQANMDQLRTYMTLGGLTGPQAGQLGAFELKQYMPYASQSPMALAMLQQQAMQAGVPGVSMGQNYTQTMRAINSHAGTIQQANQLMTQGTKAAANIPGVADFLNPNANINPLQSALYAQMAQAALSAAQHPTAANVKALTSSLGMAGVKPGQMQVGVDAILKNLHVPPGTIAKINGQIDKLSIPKPPTVTIPTHADVAQAQAAINAIHANPVNVPVRETGVATVQAAIDSIHGSSVTVTVTEINRVLTQYIGAATTPGGLAPATLVGAGGTRLHSQTGGLVPGSGYGDIVPAMLEPGEAIVPRYLVPLVAPLLAAHKVPGFGAPPGASHNFAAGGLAGSSPMTWTLGSTGPQLPLPAAVQKVLDQILQSVAHSPVWHQFGITLAGKMASSISNLPTATHGIAAALVNKLTTEIGYAKNVASAAQQGQGYGSTGLLGTFQTGVGAPTVYEQMQSYLQSEKSLTTEIASLRKGGLNKALIDQMVAAGPVAGDQLAQSVLGSYGGIKGVNSLYAQIGAASKALGAQAAMAQYPGSHIGANLQSATIVNNSVSINVTAPAGTTLSLSTSQIKDLTAIIQAELLKQARRNQKTGVKSQGKSA